MCTNGRNRAWAVLLKKIEKDTDRDYIMTPEEALEYGMIDKIITMEENK